MIKVKVSTPFPDWPLIRQTPESKGIWGNCQFFINQDIKECDYWVIYEDLLKSENVLCRPNKTILFTGEPPSVKIYNKDFLDQFGTIVTCHKEIHHPHTILTQQALPWRVGIEFDKKNRKFNKYHSKTYDELIAIKDFDKHKKISAVISPKVITEGHQKRLVFIKELKKHFKDKLDVFGSDFKHIGDKWNAIYDYKYHISIENTSYENYWTEKLSDAFLAGALPLYFGCPNIVNYFDSNSLELVDINDFNSSIKIIERILEEDEYDFKKLFIMNSRLKILTIYNLFPTICNLISNFTPKMDNKKYTIIYPNIR